MTYLKNIILQNITNYQKPIIKINFQILNDLITRVAIINFILNHLIFHKFYILEYFQKKIACRGGKKNNDNKYIVYSIYTVKKLNPFPSEEKDDISGSATQCHMQELLHHHLISFLDKVLVLTSISSFFNYLPFNFQLHIHTNTERRRNLIAEKFWREFQEQNVIFVPSSSSG